MKYGYFDDKNKEYVITRPDTPVAWANYLGDPDYGAIITNNAGGYSFMKSGANGRILRYRFNAFDEPGRYVYIKDMSDGDYWSASFKPVLKASADYKTICRHGLGYSVFDTKYRGVHSEITYFVPVNKQYEVWFVRIKNESDRNLELTLTGYCEFTSENNYEQDMVNLQYTQFITRTGYNNNILMQYVNPNFLEARPEECTQRFFALAGNPVNAYCGDRDSFIGVCRSYANPQGITEGLHNTDNFNYTACGALESIVKLSCGEEMTIAFIAGMQPCENARRILDHYCDTKICLKEIDELKQHWDAVLSPFKVNTPSKEFNSMVNIWNAYNAYITFIWSRAASLVYCGLRNGYGYRDTVQDIQGIIHLAPDKAKEKLSFMLSAQVSSGAGLPLVKFTHNPGHEDTPDDESYRISTGHPAYRADDALWLFPTVYKYIAETGDLAYLDFDIPYAEKNHDTVYKHLKKAIEFTGAHLGSHGLPAGLYADWNDCLRLGEKGESVFAAMQLLQALKIMRDFAGYKKDTEYGNYLSELITEIKHKIDLCYDEDRYIRAYTGEGEPVGKRSSREANLWLNPQSFAVISGAADKERARLIMETVHTNLNTAFGAEIINPAIHRDLFDGSLAALFNPGNKENASIFLQTQGWLILAESLIGNGNRAFEYYKESCPAYQNDIADVRCMEPYCYGQFTEGRLSPKHGRSNVHWLTGTASTMMAACVEGILGIRPDFYGICLKPAIPDEWNELQIEKTFRGKTLKISVHNHSDNKHVVLNGTAIDDCYIKECQLAENNIIEVYI